MLSSTNTYYFPIRILSRFFAVRYDTMEKAEFLAGLLKGLSGYITKLAANNNQGYTQHYDKIRSDKRHLSQSLEQASRDLNAEKNRYRNVLGKNFSLNVPEIQSAA